MEQQPPTVADLLSQVASGLVGDDLTAESEAQLLGPGDRVTVVLVDENGEPLDGHRHFVPDDGERRVFAALERHRAGPPVRHRFGRRAANEMTTTRDLSAPVDSPLGITLRQHADLVARVSLLPDDGISTELCAICDRISATFWAVTEYQAAVRRKAQLKGGAHQVDDDDAAVAAIRSVLQAQGRLQAVLSRLKRPDGQYGGNDPDATAALLDADLHNRQLAELLGSSTTDVAVATESIDEVLDQE